MEIKNYNSCQNFGALYVNSLEASKVLKKADRVVKASRNVKFVDTNIPEGHRLPLLSVLSEQVEKRQKNNKNNIVIDVLEKGKNLLTVKTLDKNGFVNKKWVVDPMPIIGRYCEIFPQGSLPFSWKSFSKAIYGRSVFFDVIDSAEVDVNILKNQEILNTKDVNVSIREFPKLKRVNRTKGKITHNLEKKMEKQKLKESNIPHVQKPFLILKDLIIEFARPAEPVNLKPQPKIKDKLPRRMKKELKKLDLIANS